MGKSHTAELTPLGDPYTIPDGAVQINQEPDRVFVGYTDGTIKIEPVTLTDPKEATPPTTQQPQAVETTGISHETPMKTELAHIQTQLLTMETTWLNDGSTLQTNCDQLSKNSTTIELELLKCQQIAELGLRSEDYKRLNTLRAEVRDTLDHQHFGDLETEIRTQILDPIDQILNGGKNLGQRATENSTNLTGASKAIENTAHYIKGAHKGMEQALNSFANNPTVETASSFSAALVTSNNTVKGKNALITQFKATIATSLPSRELQSLSMMLDDNYLTFNAAGRREELVEELRKSPLFISSSGKVLIEQIAEINRIVQAINRRELQQKITDVSTRIRAEISDGQRVPINSQLTRLVSSHGKVVQHWKKVVTEVAKQSTPLAAAS